MPKRTDPAITARLDPDLMAWVDETARLLDMSRGAFVRAILAELANPDTVTITISREDAEAWAQCDVWHDEDDIESRVTMACRAALVGEQ